MFKPNSGFVSDSQTEIKCGFRVVLTWSSQKALRLGINMFSLLPVTDKLLISTCAFLRNICAFATCMCLIDLSAF